MDPGLDIDGAVAECDWEETAGDYTVRVRRDGEETVEESVSEFARESGTECVIADSEYRNDDAPSEYRNGKRLNIFLEAACDEDGYVNRCQFTRE
ncbi:MAG: hypothetical protein ACOCY7_03110 [Halodesulfurarchaeum sp.]